jgi:multidrug efflux pump
MNIPQFFISRPIFAAVLSIVIVIMGLISLLGLPIAQYPEIVPPTISVTANYPGADAQTVAETVAQPIEKEVNGVEKMIYMQSQSASDGSMVLTVSFEVGTNLDTAQVLVQNRVAIAEAKLPEEVRRLGVTVKKKSPSLMMLINLVSPDGRYDVQYLDNYMLLQVRDVLARIPGVGDVAPFGSEYSMRIWLDPQKLAARGITPDDIIKAVQEQNIQVGAGSLGQMPSPGTTELQLNLMVRGRLGTETEFNNIIIKRGDQGQLVLLKDVARAEIGAKDYNISTSVDGMPAGTVTIYQQPGSNAIATAEAVYAAMEELSQRFPEGLEYRIVYDTTGFVEESVATVFHTLFEAAFLVILVVLIFLQNWRSTLIPMVAVPVSLIGTFAVMSAMGFSLNNLSLFGLVLAIGIVVDDAIVVVEAVELKIAAGMAPLQATREAMNEVSGALIAIAIVLTVVFVPTAFIPGMSGLFYKQFALTIAVATIISAFNSLTLSPALCALLLPPHGAKKDILQRTIDLLFGWLFFAFNKAFDFGTGLYAAFVRTLCRVAALVLLVYGGLLFLTYLGFTAVPTGFIPDQDKGYSVVVVQLPEGASRHRTDSVVNQVIDQVTKIEGVAHYVALNGYSTLTGAAASNMATVFVIFDDFHHRSTPELSANSLIAQMRAGFRNIPEAAIAAFGAPPVDGLGTTGGFKFYLQDRGSLGPAALQEVTAELGTGVMSTGLFAGTNSTFRADSPKVFLDIDREKVQTLGVSLGTVYTALSSYLGSFYINDLTLYGQSFQVKAQAEVDKRASRADIAQLQVVNNRGDLVPLSSFMDVRNSAGPSGVIRFNMFPSADSTILPYPEVSSATAIAAVGDLADQSLPPSMSIAWTEIAFQQLRAGNVALLIFPLSALFVFLVLAAQYESWSLPLAIILIVPMCLLASIAGLFAFGMPNDIFTQIGFVVLVGLACKNAILIVEFAKQIQDQKGITPMDAAVDAARIRLRPIIMTSAAFTLGVVPLMLGSGAGAEMRVSLGTAVFFGMLGVTIFGIFLTPVFYTAIMYLFGGGKKSEAAAQPAEHAHAPTPAAHH